MTSEENILNPGQSVQQLVTSTKVFSCLKILLTSMHVDMLIALQVVRMASLRSASR